MSLVKRVLSSLEKRREKILNGDINSIPIPFPRFSNEFLGIEQSRYYIITSGTKSGKTNFASFAFIYNTILYAYKHPEQIRLKIFYYPLEETPEQITCRFISFLLYRLSNRQIVVSPVDLMSSKNVAIDKRILDLLETEEYKSILDFFEKSIIFSESTNPSGVWFEAQRYAKEHGTIHYTKIKYKDEFGVEKEGEKFDHYEPDDPNEYKIIFYDHLGLTQNERGMDLRQTLTKLSEYFVLLRNRYRFTIVGIQQQNMDSDGMEAFKLQKLRPTINATADARTLVRDCDMCLGIFNPFRYELSRYPSGPNGYDITKFKDNIRFVEVLINRHGASNGMVGLLFLGQCNYWEELPLPNDENALKRIYKYLESLRNAKTSFLMYAIKKLFKRFNN